MTIIHNVWILPQDPCWQTAGKPHHLLTVLHALLSHLTDTPSLIPPQDRYDLCAGVNSAILLFRLSLFTLVCCYLLFEGLSVVGGSLCTGCHYILQHCLLLSHTFQSSLFNIFVCVFTIHMLNNSKPLNTSQKCTKQKSAVIPYHNVNDF